MIPNVFIIADKLPLTPNGKVDKKSLPLKFQEQTSLSENYVYPRNELENKLADIWKELFNLDVISMDDNFFHLGGHSLLITEMIVKIKKQINADFPLHAFLEAPTLANLAGLIESQHISINPALGNIAKIFISDTFLDPKIKPLSTSLSVIENPKAILLTGATGYLGVHLLNDLYHLSDARIYCLIRADDLEEASERLNNVLSKYKLDKAITVDNHRVVVIMGDLTKPLLGMNQITFDMLSKEIDYIYHCGAHVHHIYNYEMLREANVLSTLEVVKLATNKKNKRIHYISTLSTVISHANDHELIVEDFFDEAKLPLDTLSGYAQTKLASEIILAKAHKRGIRVSIYRPSWIVGHKDTGICSLENNHLFLLIKGCVQMGCAPKLALKLNMLPVDFVSNLIAQISLNIAKIKFSVFNITTPFTIKWSELYKHINNYGYKVKLVSAIDWQQKYLAKIDGENAIYPLISLYLKDGGVGWADAQNVFLNVSNYNTKLAMKSLGLNYMKFDAAILNRYFDFFHRCGFMPLKNM
ncbi:MAG: hypothetical protein ACD_69C00243G0001 [uncultured bacterium]|nr:MAG: hypothetical protein ACD_69C00243G0001 [uncultured bacterium]